jgi:hypothetical protein
MLAGEGCEGEVVEFKLPAGQADFILSTDETDGRRFQLKSMIYGVFGIDVKLF